VRLITAHKILISAAIALAVLLVPWGIYQYRLTGEIGSLILSGCSGVCALGMGAYLRYIVRRYGQPPK
jgi:hypothetical protein